jgi:hypothetical protein
VTPPARAEIKLRNVNMFLNGLVSDRSVVFCVPAIGLTRRRAWTLR